MKDCCFLFTMCYLLTILSLIIGVTEAIVNGKEAALDQFKYMVSIQADGKHICGGAIISKQHVLSAAQCFIGEDNNLKDIKFSVYARMIDYKLIEPPATELIIDQIFIPRSFLKTGNKINEFDYNEPGDIAVLRLNNELIFNEFSGLKQLNIPKRIRVKYLHETPLLVGYGSNVCNRGIKRKEDNRDIADSQSSKLRFAETLVLRKDTCEIMFPFFMKDVYFCAKIQNLDNNNPRGACAGDIGSPLVYDESTVIGILIQHRPDCNEDFNGSLYTRVGEYISFIKNSLINKVDDTVRFAVYSTTTETNTKSIVGKKVWNEITSN